MRVVKLLAMMNPDSSVHDPEKGASSGSSGESHELNGITLINAPDIAINDVTKAEKMTMGKLKFGSSDDLMALAAQSFAGTRTAKIINQFKEWDSTHSVEKTISKTSSSDNLLDVPSASLSKYYDSYNADKAKATRRTVIEEGAAEHPFPEDLAKPGEKEANNCQSYPQLPPSFCSNPGAPVPGVGYILQ